MALVLVLLKQLQPFLSATSAAANFMSINNTFTMEESSTIENPNNNQSFKGNIHNHSFSIQSRNHANTMSKSPYDFMSN